MCLCTWLYIRGFLKIINRINQIYVKITKYVLKESKFKNTQNKKIIWIFTFEESIFSIIILVENNFGKSKSFLREYEQLNWI